MSELELKTCSHCFESKDKLKDFYMCVGKFRTECKSCTIKRNVRYQIKTEAWKHKYADAETRREYMRKYYADNKEKYARYRQEFRKKNPHYYKEYFRDRKNKNGTP